MAPLTFKAPLRRSLLVLSFLVGSPHTQSGRASAVAGSYVAERLDGKRLPAEVRVNSTRGYYRWLKLEQAVLRLQSNGRFTVSARYDHQMVRVGKTPIRNPIKGEARQGRYTITGNTIVLKPNPTSSDKAPKPYQGTIHGAEVTVAFAVKELTGDRTIILTFRRDPSYW